MKSQIPTATAAPRTSSSGILPYRLTVRQYEKMIQAGIFRDKDRVEVLAGILVDMMTKYDPRDFAVGALGDELRPIGGSAWVVREEKSIALGAFSGAARQRAPRKPNRAKIPTIRRWRS
jgi:hypothetical protein